MKSWFKLFNYGGSRIVVPYEEYKIALGILNEIELKDASLPTLLRESKKNFFEDFFDWGSETPKGIRKNVASIILKKRSPRWNKRLFPDFSGTYIS